MLCVPTHVCILLHSKRPNTLLLHSMWIFPAIIHKHHRNMIFANEFDCIEIAVTVKWLKPKLGYQNWLCKQFPSEDDLNSEISCAVPHRV